MTLEDLHSNDELRNREFPITRHKIYLGHAGVCPLPRRIHDAVAAYTEKCMRSDQELVLPHGWLHETRRLIADFMGAKPDEIAFVGPTSLALSFIAEGLKVRRNQNVLIYQDDYPSNVYPWMAMVDRGVEVRFLNTREFGCIRARDVLGQVDENTRMVALASCHFLAGYRIDLNAIGRQLRERGILFCIDGIQTLGAFPTDLEFVDFLAADSHKWLLGPCGAGVMFVRKEVQEQLRPTAHGWHNLRCPNYVAQEELEYKPDARRYEAGSHNLMGVVALRACFELLKEIGLQRISCDLTAKRQFLLTALREKGYTVLASDAPPENSGGITTFYKSGMDLAELHQTLEAKSVVASLRGDRKGQKYIRFSPHFYNTAAELDRTVALL